jgi:PEGA domain
MAEEPKPAARSKKSEDPFLNGAPLTFEQVLKLVGQDAIPLRRRKEAILNRGIDFSMSPEQSDKLKAAGASDEILKAIKSRTKPVVAAAPPPPPKKESLGTVALTCAPAECEVSLNGTAVGPTKDGRLELSKRPGKWVIDFSEKGYIGHQSTVTVDVDRTVPVSVVLEPNRATLEAFGADLLKKVVQAVAGEDGLKELTSVQATGSLTIWSHEGSSVRWTLLMRNNPDRALFQAKAGSILHEVAFTGSEFKASKNLKGQDALDLPTDFGFIRDYQLSAVLAKVSDPQFKMVANHALPAADEEYPLVADNGTVKISIGLDSQLRPQKVRISSATGVGSAMISYSDYFKGEKAYYPKTVQIKPDGWQHGIDVRFDTVDLSPKLNAADYRLRGKALTTSGN